VKNVKKNSGHLRAGGMQAVDISDCAIMKDGPGSLVTYALGSCIAVTAFDPVACVGGLVHVMLPESQLDRDHARKHPFMYADTGVPAMIGLLERCGADLGSLRVYVAGGARLLRGNDLRIGEKNYASASRALDYLGCGIAAEAIGGAVSRTVRLEIPSGRFFVRDAGGIEYELRPA